MYNAIRFVGDFQFSLHREDLIMCEYLTMCEKEYITQRVNSQIDYYHKRADWCRRWFKGHRCVQILASAALPLLAIIDDDAAIYFWRLSIEFPFIAGFLGATITVSVSLVALNKYRERWLTYRDTEMELQRQKHLYRTKAKPYDGENAYPVLVGTIEEIISRSHNNWHAFQQVNK